MEFWMCFLFCQALEDFRRTAKMSVSQLEEDQRTFLIVGGGEKWRRGREGRGGRKRDGRRKEPREGKERAVVKHCKDWPNTVDFLYNCQSGGLHNWINVTNYNCRVLTSINFWCGLILALNKNAYCRIHELVSNWSTPLWAESPTYTQAPTFAPRYHACPSSRSVFGLGWRSFELKYHLQRHLPQVQPLLHALKHCVKKGSKVEFCW